MVHLKVGDSVGYAILESIYAECPIVCSKHYIKECRLEQLLIPGETCLTFEDASVEAFERSLKDCFDQLRDQRFNRTVARFARETYQRLKWRDVDGFREWLNRNFKGERS